MSSNATTTPRATFISDESVWSAQPPPTDVYQLRPMSQDEAPRLAATIASVYRSKLAKDTLWETENKRTTGESLDRYFHLNPYGLTNYVCEYRDTSSSCQIVGFISYQTPSGLQPSNNHRFKEVENLVVRLEHRHKGIGTHLLKQVVYDGELKGCHELGATVPEAMTDASRLFSKMGFEQKKGVPGRWIKSFPSNASSG